MTFKENNNLIPLKEIIVHWAEGKRVKEENKSYPTFKAVNDIVDLIAADERIEKVGGYCKLKYTVVWEDDTRWTDRLEITGEFIGGNYIQNDILNTCKFYCEKPSYLGESEYDDYLEIRGITKEQQLRYKYLMEKYSREDKVKVVY